MAIWNHGCLTRHHSGTPRTYPAARIYSTLSHRYLTGVFPHALSPWHLRKRSDENAIEDMSVYIGVDIALIFRNS